MGGALKNRVRIIVGLRKALGTDFPIGVKLNSTDFQKVSFNLENCITVARWLGEDSVDFLEISGGTYKQLILIGVEPTELR
jgi:2,4-dienoyl-CoA reductase-like NADH-dependent reductase (Old Yellow Enzyme family)